MQRSHFLSLPVLVLASILGGLTYPAYASEAPRWYEVELALISYQDSNKMEKESWPEILVASTDSQIIAESSSETDVNSSDSASDSASEKSDKDKNPWQWINWWNNNSEPQGLFSLNTAFDAQNIDAQKTDTQPILQVPFATLGQAFADKTEKLEKAKDFKIVWSKKWRQPIPERADALAEENLIEIDLKTALNFNNAMQGHSPLVEIEVSGKMHLYRSRYLHLITDLTVQHWQSLDNNSETDQAIRIRPSHATHTETIVPNKFSSPSITFDTVPLRAAKIEQSRRMRSNELHYIDHPLLGILVRVNPIEEEQ